MYFVVNTVYICNFFSEYLFSHIPRYLSVASCVWCCINSSLWEYANFVATHLLMDFVSNRAAGHLNIRMQLFCKCMLSPFSSEDRGLYGLMSCLSYFLLQNYQTVKMAISFPSLTRCSKLAVAESACTPRCSELLVFCLCLNPSDL